MHSVHNKYIDFVNSAFNNPPAPIPAPPPKKNKTKSKKKPQKTTNQPNKHTNKQTKLIKSFKQFPKVLLVYLGKIGLKGTLHSNTINVITVRTKQLKRNLKTAILKNNGVDLRPIL